MGVTKKANSNFSLCFLLTIVEVARGNSILRKGSDFNCVLVKIWMLLKNLIFTQSISGEWSSYRLIMSEINDYKGNSYKNENRTNKKDNLFHVDIPRSPTSF